MRFLLVNGGKTGVRTAEDLGYMLETWTPTDGALLVDLSQESFWASGPGEPFKSVRQIASALEGPAELSLRERTQEVGRCWYAEAEALALGPAVPLVDHAAGSQRL